MSQSRKKFLLDESRSGRGEIILATNCDTFLSLLLLIREANWLPTALTLVSHLRVTLCWRHFLPPPPSLPHGRWLINIHKLQQMNSCCLSYPRWRQNHSCCPQLRRELWCYRSESQVNMNFFFFHFHLLYVRCIIIIIIIINIIDVSVFTRMVYHEMEKTAKRKSAHCFFCSQQIEEEEEKST